MTADGRSTPASPSATTRREAALNATIEAAQAIQAQRRLQRLANSLPPASVRAQVYLAAADALNTDINDSMTVVLAAWQGAQR